MDIRHKLREYVDEDWKRYLKWKRNNVSFRGVSNGTHNTNGGMAKYGSGLYTAALSNKRMASEYGEVYYVVNAVPKKPKVVNNANDGEIFIQKLVTLFCEKNNVPRSNRYFTEHTTIEDEMLKLGYDGLLIKGREMVNYTPPEDVRYYRTENEVYRYFMNNMTSSHRLKNDGFPD